jgi:hypothetical protein
MLVRTECGHEFETTWSEDFIAFGPYFNCEVCGAAQAIPVENVNGDELIVTRNLNDYNAEKGYPLVDDTGATETP